MQATRNVTSAPSASSGTILAFNNEHCGAQGKGGVSLWDVTDPLKPKKLSEHFGDRGFADFNEIHSVFIWDAATALLRS